MKVISYARIAGVSLEPSTLLKQYLETGIITRNWRQVITKDIKANAMTQEQTEKLEKAAWEHVKGFTGGGPVDIEIRQARAAFRFKCGAQTILENPQEWGLVPKAQHDHYMAKYTSLVEWYDKLMGTPCEQVRHQQEIESLQAQNDRYRKALERISDPKTLIKFGSFVTDMILSRIAKEALKQQ